MSDRADKIVAVFGANYPQHGEASYETALQVGLALGRLGYAVVNGGYGGTMEASARGAKQAGAKTIGVTCTLWRSSPNRFIDDVIVTDNLYHRVERLIELGSGGFVVLPGGTGTLVELAMAWELMCKKLAAARPLVLMGDFWRPLIGMMESARSGSSKFVSLATDSREIEKFFALKQPHNGH